MTIFDGQVRAIHMAGAGSEPMLACDPATLIAGEGISGDRYALGTGHYSGRPHVDRQLTLIESEALDALERDHGVTLEPAEHRRNVTTVGVPLNHLVGRYFWAGECLLYGGRLNIPCQYLEDLVQKRVFRRLINRSGLNARVLIGGTLATGDPIRPAERADLDPRLVAANETVPVEPAPDVT